MNNFKKVGLSALCGTLASFSIAHAGSVDITGSVTATYASAGGADATTGNPWGMSHAFSVGGSGELDNGMAWTYGVAYDADFAGISSSYLSLAADGIGTLKLGFDSGDALGGIDDIVPTVWEEADGNGVSSGMDKTGGISGGILSWVSDAGVLPFGTTVKAAYTPREGGGDNTQNKAVSGSGTADTHSGWNIALTGISPVDGLTLDLGYGEIDRETAVSTFSDDWTQLNGSIKYAMGAVTVGYQRSYEDLGLAAATTTEYYENEGYGLTFAVNDNLSVGYTVFNSSKSFGDTTADVEVEAGSFQITYNIGGATVKFAHSEVDNIQYNTALKDEHTVLALGMAF